jgi:hypothetical protein
MEELYVPDDYDHDGDGDDDDDDIRTHGERDFEYADMLDIMRILACAFSFHI